MIQKASSRLYFPKQLKKAGLATHHLLHFYIAVIRPVLEHCALVWHYALTKAQTQELEAIQKRAICNSHCISLHPWNAILLLGVCHTPTRSMADCSMADQYSCMLDATNLSSLSSRRDTSLAVFSEYH